VKLVRCIPFDIRSPGRGILRSSHEPKAGNPREQRQTRGYESSSYMLRPYSVPTPEVILTAGESLMLEPAVPASRNQADVDRIPPFPPSIRF
jgi:hypothetical protein